MGTEAKSTRGTTIGIGNGDGPPETFTDIAEVTNLNSPGIENPEIAVTHLESSGVETIGGLEEAAEVTFDLNFISSDAQQQELYDLAESKEKVNWRINLHDHLTTPTTATFEAWVKSLPGISHPVGEAHTISGVTLKVTPGTVVRVFAPA